MLPASPVFYAQESVRLPYNSKSIKTPRPAIKMPIYIQNTVVPTHILSNRKYGTYAVP